MCILICVSSFVLAGAGISSTLHHVFDTLDTHKTGAISVSTLHSALIELKNRGFMTHQVMQHTATHCNTLQHTATLCNTLQHSATHSTTLHHTAPHCTIMQHDAPHCNALRHTATHCNALLTPCYTLLLPTPLPLVYHDSHWKGHKGAGKAPRGNNRGTQIESWHTNRIMAHTNRMMAHT